MLEVDARWPIFRASFQDAFHLTYLPDTSCLANFRGRSATLESRICRSYGA
jgi:hypothetical protein